MIELFNESFLFFLSNNLSFCNFPDSINLWKGVNVSFIFFSHLSICKKLL